MRKKEKKQLLQYLQSMEEVQKQIQHPDIHTEDLLHALSQLQNAGYEVGTAIEQSEGEGTRTVSLIEDYCETLYQCGERVTTTGNAEITEFRILEEQIKQIHNSLETDIPVKTEAVFIPYKASMWDSLETIWQAAKQDPGCSTFVMPIPYYDRNADGSLGEMHNERGRFPENVPTVSPEDYDLASRHPDYIFIHNPYDGFNKVTSVDPAFYSEQLQKYTDCLVYVPYFILDEPDCSNENVINSLSGFVRATGVFNAARVFVQSENMRTAYIKNLTALTGEETREYWENKIRGIGSPKIEKLLTADNKENNLPEEWRSILFLNEKRKRKAVLYNTSVTALLRGKKAWLDKIQKVLELFEQNKEEFVLWWRPHPLIQATIHAALPDLEEQWNQMVHTYRKTGYGIFDDTPDLERAVNSCDAYFGDPSSLHAMFRIEKKPAMFQNTEISYSTNKNKFTDPAPYSYENETTDLRDFLVVLNRYEPITAMHESTPAVGLQIWNYLNS